MINFPKPTTRFDLLISCDLVSARMGERSSSLISTILFTVAVVFRKKYNYPIAYYKL